MKRSRLKYLIIIFSIIGLLCIGWFYWLNPKKALDFALPDFNELSYVNAKIDSDTAYIKLIGLIENKAPYKISIDSLTYHIELGGSRIISERQFIGIQLTSGTKDTVFITFRLPISKTRSTVQKLQNIDSTDISATFNITYNTFMGRKTFPFSKKFNIKVPTPPELRLNNVKAGELNLKEKNFTIELDIAIKNNSEKIELKIRDLVYDAKIGKNISGEGEYEKMLVIKPKSSINVLLPINVIIDKPFEVFWKVVTNKDWMDYEINLHGLLDNDTIQDIPISISKIGRTQLIK